MSGKSNVILLAREARYSRQAKIESRASMSHAKQASAVLPEEEIMRLV